MKLKWQDGYVFHLIEKVHSADFIWNHTLPTFKLKNKKQQFWLALVDDMNALFTANVLFQYDEVVHKWNNLKSYFMSEKQRMEKLKRSGASADENSAWKFFESLQFLKIVSEHTPSVNNFNKRSLENLNVSREPGAHRKPEEYVAAFVSGTSYDIIEDCTEHAGDISIPTPDAGLYSHPVQQTEDSANNATSVKIISDVLISPASEATQKPRKKLFHSEKKRKQTATDMNENATALIEASQSLTNAFCVASKKNKTEERANSFGIYLGEEIAKLEPDLQLKARQKMHETLIDLQTEQLRRNGLM